MRQRSYAIGGLTVDTAWVPPAGTWQLGLNGDSRGNGLGLIGWSASNIFQFQVSGGVFNNIEPRSALVNTYAFNGGFNTRFSGKLVSFSPLRGAPISGGGRLSLGRSWGTSNQGYLYTELMQTWEANPALALSLSQKLALSGISTPWGIGLAANLQLGRSFQLIPEGVLAGQPQHLPRSVCQHGRRPAGPGHPAAQQPGAGGAAAECAAVSPKVVI